MLAITGRIKSVAQNVCLVATDGNNIKEIVKDCLECQQNQPAP